VDVYLTEPLGPFHTAAGAAFNTFTTKKDVSPLPLPVIPGGKLRRQSKLYIKASGEFSTTGTPTLALGFYIGTRAQAITTDIALSSVITTGSGAAAWPWEMEWEGFLNSDPGTAATLLGSGKLYLGTALTTFASPVPIPITQALRTVTIDTTIERAIGVSATWGTSSASNSITTNYLRALVLN
jgi:hypothetical protein